MKTVAIAGVGLIGGSFALALRRAGFDGRIIGVSSARTIAEALERKVIDEGATLEEACGLADLVYLAQPILTIIEVMPRVGRYLRPGALVTDAGSTKVRIVEAAREHLPAGSFLGGHPMAGKELRGVGASDAALFENRPYVITPLSAGDLKAAPIVEFMVWIQRIGARLVVMEPGEHDHVVARVSHVPQVLSTALAQSLDAVSKAKDIAGPAVLDLTRLAMSPYEIWHDIFVTNSTEITEGIEDVIDKLRYLQKNLNSDEVRTVFEAARDTVIKIREDR